MARSQEKRSVAKWRRTRYDAPRRGGSLAGGSYGDGLASLARNAEAQQRSLDRSHTPFDVGVARYLPVLTAHTGLHSTQIDLVSTRLARLMHLVDLYRYLAGGWIERTDDTPRPVAAVSPDESLRLATGDSSRSAQ